MGYIDRKRKKALVKFKWRQADEMSGFMKDIFPRLYDKDKHRKFMVNKIWFSKPSNELEKAYKQKKQAYMQERVEKWMSMLVDEKGNKKLIHIKDIAKEILNDKDKYLTDGQLDKYKVLSNYEIGETKARDIIKTIESMES